MASIALIGPDGAGKTTICRMLEQSSLLPFKYVYMGLNYSASNVALPSTRLLRWWRKRRGMASTGAAAPAYKASRPNRRGGTLRGMLRLLHLLGEEWFRAGVAWHYERRGFVVLCDRHFVFDFAGADEDARQEPAHRRLHRWLLARYFPRPDLVFLLDAPAELLYARKGEFTPEILERRRRALLHEAQRCRNFVRVDVAQPVDRVYDEVAFHVLRFCRRPGTSVAA